MPDSGWRDIADHDGYQVHSDGLVRSCWKRGVGRWNGGVGEKGPWRLCKKTFQRSTGYYSVGLGVGRKAFLHRILAGAFIPKPKTDEFLTVNHKDGVKTNNALSNLEWATYKENLNHATRVLKLRIGEKHGRAKLTQQQVREIRALRASGKYIREIAEAYKTPWATIQCITSGKTWAIAS
jgi:hypothetical protein